MTQANVTEETYTPEKYVNNYSFTLGLNCQM